MTSQLGESGQIPTSSGGALEVTGSSSTGASEEGLGGGGVLAEVILDLGSGSGGSKQVDLDTPGGGHGCSQVLEAYIQAVMCESWWPQISQACGFQTPGLRVNRPLLLTSRQGGCIGVDHGGLRCQKKSALHLGGNWETLNIIGQPHQ